MSGFVKYQHVERLGTPNVSRIDEGLCYIFPKIDGTNASIWCVDGVIKTGSRNRELSIESDNAGFHNWVIQQDNIKKFFEMFPEIRLYGEWLVPHSLKTYDDSAWRNFYVFDVMIDGSPLHVCYDDYKDKLEKFGINYIPVICKVTNPTNDTILDLLEKTTYLIKDGQGAGEGLLIKRYDYTNSHGNQVWAKVVRHEFQALHSKTFKVGEIKQKSLTEEAIVDKYVTVSLCEKEYAKINNETPWETKFIPRLLNMVFYSLITEETWNFVKEFKKPTVNFGTLLGLTNRKVKELMPHLF